MPVERSVSRRHVPIAVLLLLLSVSACSFLTSLDGLAGADAGDASIGDAARADGGSDTDGSSSTLDSGGDASSCGNAGPTAGLLLYYPFDEGAGNTAHDCSDNHYDGTFVRQEMGGSWAPGHIGGAIHVSGTNGCVDVGMPANLSPQVLSIAAWINVATFPSPTSSGYVIGQTLNANSNGWRFGTRTVDGGTLVGWLSASSGMGYEVDVDAPAASTWHHIAVTLDPATQLQLFIDGTSATTRSRVPAIVYAAASLRVGCRADDANYFDGLIDEVRMYDRVLTQAEIKQLSGL